MLIAVYGSLRKGCYNHDYFLSEAEFLGLELAKGKLVDLGAYPALTEGSDDVEVEIYLVGPYVHDSIDMMERGAGYVRENFTCEHGSASLWRMDKIHLRPEDEHLVVLPDKDGVVRWQEEEN